MESTISNAIIDRAAIITESDDIEEVAVVGISNREDVIEGAVIEEHDSDFTRDDDVSSDSDLDVI